MATFQCMRDAARVLRQGGVITYPTEGVFGLGCLPDDHEAVARILAMKRRDAAMGLILVVSRPGQLAGFVDLPVEDLELGSADDRPVTWIVPATEEVPPWIRGDHPGVAVRLTTHPVARALCEAVDSALVSTSANVSGRPPARSPFVLRRRFGALVDYVVPGRCGPARGASEIRDLATGRVLRPA